LFNDYGVETREIQVQVNDIPEQPQHMFITEIGHDYATVNWDKPTYDGGSQITGYVVEKKDINRRVFQRVGQVSGHKRDLFVEDLDYENTYVFRIAAVNRFGIGEFSDTVEVSTGNIPLKV
jgi:titin